MSATDLNPAGQLTSLPSGWTDVDRPGGATYSTSATANPRLVKNWMSARTGRWSARSARREPLPAAVAVRPRDPHSRGWPGVVHGVGDLAVVGPVGKSIGRGCEMNARSNSSSWLRRDTLYLARLANRRR